MADLTPEQSVRVESLAEAKAKLAQIRAIVAVEDDSPEGEMGPRWILGQIKEVLDGGS